MAGQTCCSDAVVEQTWSQNGGSAHHVVHANSVESQTRHVLLRLTASAMIPRRDHPRTEAGRRQRARPVRLPSVVREASRSHNGKCEEAHEISSTAARPNRVYVPDTVLANAKTRHARGPDGGG